VPALIVLGPGVNMLPRVPVIFSFETLISVSLIVGYPSWSRCVEASVCVLGTSVLSAALARGRADHVEVKFGRAANVVS
jgi:hypothetical protein